MRSITHAVMRRIQLPDGPLLELGCGGGTFLRELSLRQWGRQMLGVDLHPAALVHARQRLGSAVEVVGASLLTLPFPEATFGTVIALDAFDQQGVNLPHALAESNRMLSVNGMLILRVSAHKWIHSEHDAMFNTGHRYSRSEIHTILAHNGFQPILTTYANSILLLPIVIVRLLQRHRLVPFIAAQYRSSRFDLLIGHILKLEARWIGRWNMPLGISLYVLAKKTEAPTRT